jgi:hypothetical protein
MNPFAPLARLELNSGGPMSRRRTERVLATVLRDIPGAVHLPRVLRAGLKFMVGDEPVDRVLTALARYGLDDAERLRERFAIPGEAMIVRVVADAPWGVAASFAKDEAVLREALLLGLCTAWQYDPARPVIWTRTSLTRHVELHAPAGFYA